MEKQRKGRTPVINYRQYYKGFFSMSISADAARLLTQAGESHAIIYKDRNDNIFIKPIDVECGEIICINKIFIPTKKRNGPIKLAATHLEKDLPVGKYEVVWDDVRGALRIKKQHGGS